MEYQLRVPDGSGEPVATADLPDRYDAEAWARDWVKTQATGGAYALEGGGLSWSLFRTHAGQWYMTSTTERPAA